MDLGARLEVVERLSRLRDEGALTEEEFATAKLNALRESVETVEAVKGPDDEASFGDANSNYLKWAIAAALVTVVVGGAYFFLPKVSGDSEIPAVAEPATSTESAPGADETSSTDIALEEAANAVEAAGASVDETVAEAGIPTTTETEVAAQPPTRAVSYEPRDAKPARDLQSYVSSDDYPSSSIQRGEQGSVGFTLTISPNGRATDCSITASSGFRTLDAATCNIMTRRARFTPAYDATGAPVVGSVSSTIGWRLAD